MTATFPLQSWRMSASWLGLSDQRFGRRRQPVDDDGARLRAAIEANAASGAIVAAITRWVNSVGTQFGSEFQTFRRTGLNTEPASLALLNIDRDTAACWACHIFLPRDCRLCGLRMLQPFGLLAVFVKLGAEIGMGDLNQRLGPLSNRLAVQICNSVFRHDVAHQAARGDHSRSRI